MTFRVLNLHYIITITPLDRILARLGDKSGCTAISVFFSSLVPVNITETWFPFLICSLDLVCVCGAPSITTNNCERNTNHANRGLTSRLTTT